MRIDIRQVSSFIFLVVIITAASVLSSTQFALRTADDSSYIQTALIKNSTRQVLGASTNTIFKSSDFCPDNKNVLGFLDYNGSKIILGDENKFLEPTACFENIEQANSEGYFLVK